LDVKGNNNIIAQNTRANALKDAFQNHVLVTGWETTICWFCSRSRREAAVKGPAKVGRTFGERHEYTPRMKRIGVVSGANRGIGLEISRRLAEHGVRVVLTSRDEAKGRASAEQLKAEELPVEHYPLDVTSADSIRALAEHLKKAHGGVDILVNNAGVSFSGFNAEIARATLDVNFFGPLHVTDALLPLMRSGGRIVMVTSGLGDRSSLSGPLRQRFSRPAEMSRDDLVGLMRQFIADVAAGKHARAGWPSSAYGVSKIGLNVLTAQIGKELQEDGRGILCNAACPGWVRTDMGGSAASRSVEEGAETPVWLALLPEGGPQGGVFRDMAKVDW